MSWETKNEGSELWELAYSFANYTNEHLFITGKAGTGKTTFLRQLTGNSNKRHIVLAPTGVAAMNAGGVTVNSFFQIPPGYYLPIVSDIPAQGIYSLKSILNNLNYSSKKKELIRNLEAIIIDEVSMIRPDQIDTIDEILRAVRNSNLPFGGIQLVLIGDLFQLPPVVSTESFGTYCKYYVSGFFFNAYAFKVAHLIQIEFNKVFRQTDEQFVNILNEIRTNTVTANSLSELNGRYLPNFIPEQDENFITLTSHNQEAVNINNERLSELPDEEYIFEAEVSGDFKEGNFPADKNLRLRRGAQVMFLKNDSGNDRKFYNGKIGKVNTLSLDSIEVAFPDGSKLQLKRDTWYNLEYRERTDNTLSPEPVGEFRQFPVRLAWAITIHKSQGLTFEKAIIDAAQSFAAGQAYVALSRVKSLNGLVLRSEITFDSIITSKEIATFLSHESEVVLQKQLNNSQKAYLFEILIGNFSFNKLIRLLSELLQKPETFKQKVEIDTLILLERLLTNIQQLEGVIKRFTNEVGNSNWNTVDINYLRSRFVAASNYIEKQLQQIYLNENLAENPGISKTAQGYIALIRSNVGQNENIRLKSINIIDQLIGGSKIPDLIKKGKELRLYNTQEIPVKEKKQKRTYSSNNSVQGTIDLVLEGKNLSEIAEIRNLGINTIESHILDGLKNGILSIGNILDAETVRIIQSEVAQIGKNVYDLKEKLGENFSFFEIRATILISQ